MGLASKGVVSVRATCRHSHCAAAQGQIQGLNLQFPSPMCTIQDASVQPGRPLARGQVSMHATGKHSHRAAAQAAGNQLQNQLQVSNVH
eukprot:scaffold211784_cov15-Tisochrysis_lutea.AAC.1